MKFIKRLLFGLSFLPVVLFAIVITAFIVKTWLVLDDEKVGFDLATISAIIGGFILAGAFIDRQDPYGQARLRRIGLVYLISTIAFVVLAMSAPILNDFWLAPYLGAASIATGAVFFALGTVLLVREIPRLW